MDAAGDAVPDVAGAGRPLTRFVGNVVFHSGPGVNLGLYRKDGSAESFVELGCVHPICIAQGIVNVLLCTVDAKPFGRDLKFFGRISKCHEGEDPDEDTDGLGVDTLQGSNVQSLGVVPQEVAEVNALDEHGRPFFAM